MSLTLTLMLLLLWLLFLLLLVMILTIHWHAKRVVNVDLTVPFFGKFGRCRDPCRLRRLYEKRLESQEIIEPTEEGAKPQVGQREPVAPLICLQGLNGVSPT